MAPGALNLSPQNGAPTDNIGKGTLVDLSVNVTNNGVADAENFTVAFYLVDPSTSPSGTGQDPAVDGVLIGSTFIENLAAGASSSAQTVVWNTAGLTEGDYQIYVIVDASGAIAESNEDNNQASADAVIKKKPDLLISSAYASGLRQNESGLAMITIDNDGQADVYGALVKLFQGADENGTLLGSTTADVLTGQTVGLEIPFTIADAGVQPLFVLVDPDDTVLEADESNNSSPGTVQVGWDALTVDAGGSGDTAYDAQNGYGWLAAGTAVTACGTNIEQSYRQAGSAEQLQYQFDNLLPGRRYHLDLTFATCSGQRWVDIYVDGQLTGEDFPTELAMASYEPVHVTTTPQTVSITIDPADYVDGTITLALGRADGFSGPLVNIIDLTEITSCYRDSGPGETAWSAENGCGYDPAAFSDGYDGWGTTPEETIRFSESGQVDYKFSSLDVAESYNLKLTFYEEDGFSRQQRLLFDGVPSEPIVLGSNPDEYIIQIPAAAYTSDDEVIVTIECVSPAGCAAIVSEVTLEQVTRRYAGVPPVIEPTPTPTAAPSGDPQVELDSFSAAWAGEQVFVEWGTLSEVDNSDFILYRSTDSLTWVEIHAEPSTRACGVFTGTDPVVYSYTDSAVTPGTTYYYRLQYSGANCGGGVIMGMSIASAIAEPEMDVKGNGLSIQNGDTTPDETDHTDYGVLPLVDSALTHTFTIQNTGTAELLLSGSPLIALSGENAADFEVVAEPDAVIPPGGSTTFTVRFDPSANGLRTATISIANSDNDNNPYQFAIQGSGTSDCTISGTIDLQSRDDNSGAILNVVGISAGAFSTTIGASGQYELVVPEDTYDLTVELVPYLDAYVSGVVCAAGGTQPLSTIELLGGDANADCTINILDLTFMGARFNLSTGEDNFNTAADVNADGTINILDLSVTGNNFLQGCLVP